MKVCLSKRLKEKSTYFYKTFTGWTPKAAVFHSHIIIYPPSLYTDQHQYFLEINVWSPCESVNVPTNHKTWFGVSMSSCNLGHPIGRQDDIRWCGVYTISLKLILTTDELKQLIFFISIWKHWSDRKKLNIIIYYLTL